MYKQYLLVLLFCLLSVSWSRAQVITLSSTAPASVTVCGSASTFTVTLTAGATNFSALSMTITMPSGMRYVTGSATYTANSSASPAIGTLVTETNVATLNAPVFSVTNLSSGQEVTITYQAQADCNLAGASAQSNNISVSYSGGVGSPRTHSTAAYNFSNAVLTIQSVSNNSFSGQVGQSYTRAITIRNSGFAPLSSFFLRDQSGSGLSISSTITNGTLSSSSGTNPVTREILVNSFTSIGDGDNVFENNETIVITETVTIVACTNLSTNFRAYYGCFSSSDCGNTVAGTATAGATVTGTGTPNLVYLATVTGIKCSNQSALQQLRVINTAGSGSANNISITLSETNGNGLYVQSLTKIDTSTLRYKKGLSGTLQRPTMSNFSAQNLNNLFGVSGSALNNCMSAGSKLSRVTITLPPMAANDTIYIQFNQVSPDYCCMIAAGACVDGTSQRWVENGWIYQATYTDACGTTSYTPAVGTGRAPQYFGPNEVLSAPTDLNTGQSGTINLDMPLFWLGDISTATGAYLEFTYTLPAGYTSSTPVLIRGNGTNAPLTVTSTPSGSSTIISAKYTLTASPRTTFTFTNFRLQFNLTLDCAAGGFVNSPVSITIKTNVVRDPTACPSDCAVPLGCKTMTITPHCGCTTSPGMVNLGYTQIRTSYGKPDNNNDGLADGSGTLDMTKINLTSLYPCDTMSGDFIGVIRTDATHTQFEQAYATQTFSTGANFTVASATARIVDVSAGVTYSCAVTSSVASGKITYNLKSMACLPGGFIFGNGDSVYLYSRLRNNANTNRAITTTTEFYASHIASPTNAADKLFCDNYKELINLIQTSQAGGGSTASNNSCNEHTIQADISLRTNNADVNTLFPYEVRNVFKPTILTATIPSGFVLGSAQPTLRFTRNNAGSNVVMGPYNITPTLSGSTLTFDIGALIDNGTIPFPDEGPYFNIRFPVVPTCAAVPSAVSVMKQTYVSACNTFTNTFSPAHTLTYSAPVLALSTGASNKEATTGSVSWDVTVTNSANNSDAGNAWLAEASGINGMTITSIQPLSSCSGGTPGTAITPDANGFYQLGTFVRATQKCYRITATYTNCTKDSLELALGWGCSGYPSSYAAYPCTPVRLKLTATAPTPPAQLTINILSEPSGAQNFCGTFDYEVIVRNTGRANAKNIRIEMELPFGTVTSIVANSSYLVQGSGSYPGSSNITPTSTGTVYSWSLASSSPVISILPGADLAPNNEVKLKYTLSNAGCNFVGGAAFRIRAYGEDLCGTAITAPEVSTVPLVLNGVPTTYNTYQFKNVVTPFNFCPDEDATFTITAINLGPTVTTANEYMALETNSAYELNGTATGVDPALRFVPIRNAPTSLSTATSGPNTQYSWAIPAGIAVGDSIQFRVSVTPLLAPGCQADPEFLVSTYKTFSLTCGLSTCNIQNITSSKIINSIGINKQKLAIPTGSAIGTLDNSGDEIIDVSYSIQNTGAYAITPGSTITTQLYWDADASGTLTGSDVQLGADEIINGPISAGATQTVNIAGISTAMAGVGACPLLVHIVADPACQCDISDKFISSVPLVPGPAQVDLCYFDSVSLGYPAAIPGYLYAWSASPTEDMAWLSSATGSEVQFKANDTTGWASAGGGLTFTSNYTLTIDRGVGCVATQDFSVQAGPCILPMEWIWVKGEWLQGTDQQMAAVSWQVADDAAVSGYQLERSYDGKTFADVLPEPTPAVAANAGLYTSVDYSVSPSSYVYYRVRATDVEGRISTSPLVQLYHDAEPVRTVKVFPNPATDLLYCQYNGYPGDAPTLRLIDATGRILLQHLVENMAVTTVSLEDVPAGWYTVQVIDHSQAFYYSFPIQVQ